MISLHSRWLPGNGELSLCHDDAPLAWHVYFNTYVVNKTHYLFLFYRPLSRRLDRCDRVIHNESGDPNGGNMCSFSRATCTSRDVTMQITFLTRKSALIYRRDLRQRVASLTLNCNGVLAIRAYADAFSSSNQLHYCHPAWTTAMLCYTVYRRQ